MLLIAAIITASGWAATGASPEQPRGGAAPELADFLSLPFVEEKPDGGIVVDFSSDPDAAFAALEAAEQALQEVEITVTGLGVVTPNDRRQEDAELSRLDVPVSKPLCPDQPAGSRSLDGSTIAYLGCDPSDGKEIRSQAFAGSIGESLTAAIEQVLAVHLPDRELGTVTVKVSDGAVVVDLPMEIGRPPGLPKADGRALAQALIFTAYSNGNIDSIRFTIGDDCLVYAFAVGGDSCSTVAFAESKN